ncbi:ComEC/Rec2 family competence protein [Bosea sp. 685]|uniref:ComEC/Rec2 family competence protein n=1 Tax=Bosea sp. 685 TaxID=3080057 RepID=UPI0028936B9F|nr:MBL fold metallo-hydrolase [Bosea sp. 685]WNJ89585.1 MBL fold metallo-hydrolase [Bosea sp. 685]
MSFFMLDMGSKIYGDCLLVHRAGKIILIDGGHPGDEKPRGASEPSIPDQLKIIFGKNAPFDIDLLIVTHCHLDHIGCLPQLVADGTIRVRTALLADPDLGMPRSHVDSSVDAVTNALVRGLREESRAELPPDELRQFLADAATIEDLYREMLRSLAASGARVIKYTGLTAEIKALEAEFATFSLQVLGPTKAHLELCRDAILASDKSASDAITQLRNTDLVSGLDSTQLYRLLAAGPTGPVNFSDDLQSFMDAGGNGAAINNQSIVLKIVDGNSMLLTGDMQLEAAGVGGLSQEMTALLKVIKSAGPYKFVKAPHHAASNGMGEKLLKILGAVDTIGISTGRQDPGHPHPKVLALLQARKEELSWVRTDKNGLVQVVMDNDEVRVRVTSGKLDDASLNARDDGIPGATVEPPGQPPQSPVLPPRSSTAPEPPRPLTPQVQSSMAEPGIVEVTAKIPAHLSRVTITVEIGSFQPTTTPVPPRQLANDHEPDFALPDRLPRLMFVTNSQRLGQNIGSAATGATIAAARQAGHNIVDLADGSSPGADAVRRKLVLAPETAGVVIVGGYDVVPAERYDTLPPGLRARVSQRALNSEPDNFIVWSDQIYGDSDGDGLANVPVSRVPDGGSADLVRVALTAPQLERTGGPFGIRNAHRPFADRIFQEHLRADPPMYRSQPVAHQTLSQRELDADMIYVMLHGSDGDASRFWGEDENSGMLEAMHVGQIPNPCGATIFSGCCWGALTVRDRASRFRDRDTMRPLQPRDSLALSFLAAGARAFVGCTGAHYSPLDGDMDYFGAPMHDAFWKYLKQGQAPSKALHSAKVDYLANMPHRRTVVEEQAIEHKILRQFTCLGLGW